MLNNKRKCVIHEIITDKVKITYHICGKKIRLFSPRSHDRPFKRMFQIYMAKVPFSCDNTSALNYLLLTFPVVTESFFSPVNYAFVRSKIIQPEKFTDKIIKGSCEPTRECR